MDNSYRQRSRKKRNRRILLLGILPIIAIAIILLIVILINTSSDKKKTGSDNPPTSSPIATGMNAPTTSPAITCTDTPEPSPATSDAEKTPIPSTGNVQNTATPSPTPSSTPSPTPTEKIYTDKVIFSENEAIYTADTEVALSFDSKINGTIYYTLDGTIPDESSTIYTDPITLNAAADDDISIYQINAIAKTADGNLSDVVGHTYFVGKNAEKRFSTLVISIYGDENELTSDPDGILTNANVTKKGRDYERKVFIQAFTSDELIFDHFGGVRAYGGKSRNLSIPSLKIYARSEYSSANKKFKISVFETPRIDNPEKIVKKYDKLTLRNGGDDFQSGMIRDELTQLIARNAGFTDYEASVPVTVFLNGKYYGLMWLHESYCDDYFQNKYGEGKGEFIIVEGSETAKSLALADNDEEKEAVKEYNSIYKKYAYSDLSIDTAYQELCTYIDIENYIKYYAFQLYSGNFDWPNHNYKCYRYYAGEGESYSNGVFDGRWRFLLHDTDNGLGMFTKGTNIKYEYDDWKDVTSQKLNNETNERYSPLFTNLMKRADCKKLFLDYTEELMNGAFSYESVKAQLDLMNEQRYTELMNYYYPYLARLKEEGDTSIWSSEKYYQIYYEQILDFAKNRQIYAKKYLNELFD